MLLSILNKFKCAFINHEYRFMEIDMTPYRYCVRCRQVEKYTIFNGWVKVKMGKVISENLINMGEEG